MFGGHEVGIGFAGTCDEAGAELEAIALAGKRSLRLAATLKLMRPAAFSAKWNLARAFRRAKNHAVMATGAPTAIQEK